MIDYILAAWPILLVLVVYFVRLETKLATICADLAWLKKYIHACQRN